MKAVKYLKYLVVYKNKCNSSNGLVGAPDFFSGTTLGSSCHPAKKQVI
jgi:hypothetical protein